MQFRKTQETLYTVLDTIKDLASEKIGKLRNKPQLKKKKT